MFAVKCKDIDKITVTLDVCKTIFFPFLQRVYIKLEQLVQWRLQVVKKKAIFHGKRKFSKLR